MNNKVPHFFRVEFSIMCDFHFQREKESQGSKKTMRMRFTTQIKIKIEIKIIIAKDISEEKISFSTEFL